MKINKKFIDLLLEKREAYVSELLDSKGLNYFVEKRVNNIVYPKEYNQKSLEPVEDILYTINFLIKEKLVEKTGQYSPAIPSFGKLSAIDFSRCEYAEKELKEIYGLMLKAKLELFDYKERRYKTEKQKQERSALLLNILYLILAVIFGYFLPKILGILEQILKGLH